MREDHQREEGIDNSWHAVKPHDLQTYDIFPLIQQNFWWLCAKEHKQSTVDVGCFNCSNKVKRVLSYINWRHGGHQHQQLAEVFPRGIALVEELRPRVICGGDACKLSFCCFHMTMHSALKQDFVFKITRSMLSALDRDGTREGRSVGTGKDGNFQRGPLFFFP